MGCIPEPIPIELPPFEPKIVVNTRLVPPDILLVSLSRSYSALDNTISEDTTGEALRELLIRGADVRLGTFGFTTGGFEINEGLYAIPLVVAQPGLNYRLDVTDRFGESVFAETRFRPLVNFSSITPRVERTPTDTSISLEYTIRDGPGNNWYLVNYYTDAENTDTTFNANSILGGDNDDDSRGYELISDHDFGGARTFTNTIEFDGLRDTNRVALSISAISEEYYNYLVLRKQAGSIFSDIISEPVNYPTNVEGGLGFFSLHVPRFHFFEVADY